MKLALPCMCLIALTFIPFGAASAQAQTGLPNFAAFGGGPDEVNLANLNVHFAMPAWVRAGRGLPFVYDLSYDSSIWTPSASNGTGVWTPATNWGFTVGLPAWNGQVTYSSTSNCTYIPPPYNYELCTYSGSNYTYRDPNGTLHASTYSWYEVCAPGCSGGSSGSPVATDGSGYSISSNGVTDRSGTAITMTTGTLGTAGSIEDTNGNYISANTSGSNYVLTDTLGSTAITLQPSTCNAPCAVTYTVPTGTVTISYESIPIRTNFGCSGITEFGPHNENLPYTIELPDGTAYVFIYEQTPGYSGDYTGRIAEIVLPNGGQIKYSYSGGGSGVNGITCSDGTPATVTRVTPDGTWTYTHAENGTAWQTTTTDPQNNQTVMDFQGIYPTETDVYQGSATPSNLLKTTLLCYNGTSPSGSPASCDSSVINLPITEVDSYTQLPGGLESEVATFYDRETSGGTTTSYGLVTEKDEYDYGTGARGSLVRKTLTTYASLSNGIVNRPSSITVCSGTGTASACNNAGTVVAQTTLQYDQGSPTSLSGTLQHASISGSRGNPTTISSLTSGSSTLNQTFSYYDTGNIDVATDVNSATRTYNYSNATSTCGNTFATSVNEPLGLSESMTWNCTSAAMASLTDENSKTTSYSYLTGPFSEMLHSITDPLGNVTNLSYSGQASVESALNFNSGSSTTDVLTTSDSTGRPHFSQTRQAPGSNTFDSVETDYDSLGRPNRVTVPYAAAAGAVCSGSCPATTITYDALGRPLTVTDGGGGTISYTYSGNDVLQTLGPAPSGEHTKQRQFEYDALGRLTSVCEITAGTTAAPAGTCGQTTHQTGYWTEYTYNAINSLTGVVQNSQGTPQQTRSYGYDGVGRLTSESNPESGTTTYIYDTDATCGGTFHGDLVKKVDSVGNTTCYAYDALHRTTSTTYSGPYASVTPTRHFVYDSATVNGVGMVDTNTHLAEAYSCFSSCSTKTSDIGFSYSARGEVSDVYESTPHSSGYYHVTETYWANGALEQISGLPGLPNITYGVDGEGRTYSVSASSGQNPLASTNYSPASLPTQVTLGSSDSDSYAYDPNTNRMTQYEFTVNGSSLTGNLTWNANGSLASLAITDPFNSSDAQTCNYSHDDLSRILTADCASAANQTFSYDAFGNIDKSGSPYSFEPTYSTSPSTNHMTQIGSSYPTYDANGDVTNDFLNNYSWDANGRPVTVDGVSITYDALGRMVEQSKSGTYDEVVYDPQGNKLAFMTGQTLSKAYVQLPAGDIATYGSSGLSNYHHMDWLGSFRLASTPTRTAPFDTAYAPFGEPYDESGGYTVAFTGQTQDTAPNVYDFPAREYGIQGRWPSPDPAGLAAVDPTDPQTWNRYAYVRNSPLMLADPTGEDGDGPVITLPGDTITVTASPFGCGPVCAWFYEEALSSLFQPPFIGPLLPPIIPSGGGGALPEPVVPSNMVPANPCQYQGRALSPSDYATSGKADKGSNSAIILNSLTGFPRGHFFDPQPLANGNALQNAAYGNYTFGVYMAAAEVPLSTALSGANSYALFSGAQYTPAKNGPMDPNYTSLPAANVENITNGYNAQQNGTTCSGGSSSSLPPSAPTP